MKIFALVTGLLLITSFAFAADIDGTWNGDYQGMAMSFTFKADGNTLTGTDNGSKNPIKDGKIDGNQITFVLGFDFQGQKWVFNYKGVLSGNKLDLSFTQTTDGKPGNNGAFSLKKK